MKYIVLVTALAVSLPLILGACGDEAACEEGDVLECDCGMDFVGEQTCTEESVFGECECGACVEFAVTVCTCEGVDEYFDQTGTTCLESYAQVVDSGIDQLCAAALDAWELVGGCEQFSAMTGDDDDTVWP